MTIEVQVRLKYGRELIYPVNDAAKIAVQLTGRKTFFVEDLRLLQALGHDVVWVPQSIAL